MHVFGPVASVAGLSAVAKVNAVEIAVVVVVVVVTSEDPLNSLLFLQGAEEAGVQSPAADFFAALAEELVVVVEVDVLGERDVHEQEALALARVCVGNSIICLTEPFNLVRPDAIVSTDAHTVSVFA